MTQRERHKLMTNGEFEPRTVAALETIGRELTAIREALEASGPAWLRIKNGRYANEAERLAYQFKDTSMDGFKHDDD